MEYQQKHNNQTKPITKNTLEQVLQYLKQKQIKPNYSQLFYCNYENILAFIQSILNRSIHQQYQQYLSNATLIELMSMFSLTNIIYAILFKIYSSSINLVNAEDLQANQFLISNMPNEPILLLESFLSILQETNSIQQSLCFLKLIGDRISKSVKKVQEDPQSKLLLSQIEGKRKVYKTRISVKGYGKRRYQRDDLICSNNSNYYQQRSEFYIQFVKNLENHFSKEIALEILDQALLQFGTMTYIETINLQQIKNQKNNHNIFPMEMPVVQSLADINNFQINLIFIQNKPNQSVLEIAFKIKQQEMNTIPMVDFHRKQIQISQVLRVQKFTSKIMYVQNMIHRIDLDKQIGKGSYGVVNRCQSLQLYNYKCKENSKIYLFKKHHLATKQIIVANNQHQYQQVPLNRQHLILTLIKQIKHKQQIKKINRSMGLSQQRQIVGIDRIISMVQYFKVPSFSKKKKQQVYYIVFQLVDKPLNNMQFLSNFYKNNNYHSHLYNLFYQILQSINFLNYQLNNLYPKQLNRYFKLQNKDVKNMQRQQFQQLDPKGRNGIYHRDIKPANIMLNYNQRYEITQIYLIDFGMAKITDFNRNTYATNCGSTYYMAPEVRNGIKHNQTIDLWGAGLIIYQMYAKNQKKLYGNTQIHAMNLVNQKLKTYVDTVDQPKWRQCLHLILKERVQQRSKASQILQFLINQKSTMNKQRLQDIFKEFDGCKQYNLTQENDQIKIIEQQRNKIAQQNICFNAFNMDEYLSNNMISHMERLKSALVVLYHINCNYKAITLKQANNILYSSRILQLLQNNSSHFQIILKNQQSSQNYIDHFQTLKLALLEQKQQKNTIALLSTHKTYYKFNPWSLDGFEKQNKYNIGLILSQKSIFQENIKIFRTISKKLTEEIIVAEQTNIDQIIVLKHHTNDQFQLLIPNASKIQLLNINQIYQKILVFIKFHKDSGKKIVIQKNPQQFTSKEALVNLAKCKYNKQILTISFNQSIVNDILHQSSQIFKKYTKQNMLKLIEQVSCNYVTKFYICLYLQSSSIEEFTKLQMKYRSYGLNTKKLELQVQQFKSLLLFLHQTTQSKIKCKVIQYIRDKITLLSTRIVQYLKSDQQQMEEIQYQLQTNLLWLNKQMNSLQKLFTNQKEQINQKVKNIKYLGCKILQILKLLKMYIIHKQI